MESGAVQAPLVLTFAVSCFVRDEEREGMQTGNTNELASESLELPNNLNTIPRLQLRICNLAGLDFF